MSGAPEYYPLYAKCCELGVLVGLNLGPPGSRVSAKGAAHDANW